MSSIKIRVSKEFTKFPGGRLRVHGPKSGEEFREEILLPLFEKHDHITVDLSGVMGYGASFLDESFGELGKRFGLSEVQRKLTLIADDDPNLVDVIWNKVRIAAAEKK